MKHAPLEVGQKVGRLTLLSSFMSDLGRGRQWNCRCDCGTELIVANNKLNPIHKRSCGCLRPDIMTKHDKSRTPACRAWVAARWRCNMERPNPHRYALRGIRMCRRWRESFEEFFSDMGQPDAGRSLDRIDNNGHYSCGQCTECAQRGWRANCRWATKHQQSTNRENNVFLEHRGERRTISEWSEIVGILPVTLYQRRMRGWSDQQILMTPLAIQAAKSKQCASSRP